MITEEKIVYLQAPGPENTQAVFRIAKARAEQLGIKNILVVSTTGGAKATEFFKGTRVIVSHFTGFRGPNTQELHEESSQTTAWDLIPNYQVGI